MSNNSQELNRLKEQVSFLMSENDKRKINQIQLPADITSINVLKEGFRNTDLEAQSLILARFLTTATGNITTLNITDINVGADAGVSATINILDGDTTTTHTLTFKKGILTNYIAV